MVDHLLKNIKFQELQILGRGVQITEEDFPGIESIFQKLAQKVQPSEIPYLTRLIHWLVGEDIMHNTVQGFAYRKPHGYAGDFEIIDKMYCQEIHDNPKYGIWDKFYHFNAAAKAVRNRKEFFKTLIGGKLSSKKHLHILNLASGPGRDIYEFFKASDRSKSVTIDCVEMDENAIEYAASLNRPYLDQIRFIHQNVFRFHPAGKYDLIWSAGLFDYFEDKVFVKLLNRMRAWTRPEGEIIIGNFSKGNPTQGYMLIMVDWILHLRSKEQLRNLAQAAGYSKDLITIAEEETGVNLFLHLNS